jgi:hypothetical protein
VSAILRIAAALLELVLGIWQRRAKQADNPDNQHAKRVKEADQAIANGDAGALSVWLNDQLDRLPDDREADRRGPRSDPDLGGTKLPGDE